jgi:ceramide glucosyltransferase
MLHNLAFAVEMATTLLALAGLGYYFAALVATYLFLGASRPSLAEPAPSVSILKPLKGLDPAMLDAFRSHCRQQYAGEYELIFGVSSLDDPAAAAVHQLQQEFPGHAIRLIECPQQFGTNRKVGVLIQLAPHARHQYLLINDSDITVGPHYLERVLSYFAPARPLGSKRTLGIVTALYRGRAHGTLGSRLEAMGLSTDFHPAVLLARVVERGLRYALGSTLCVSREALASIGGLEVLADQLADDYELGARIYAAGHGVALCDEPVETSVPDYRWRDFVDHQLRWYRTVRDARPAGYVGLIFTHGFAWAVLNAVASGFSPLSLWLLAMVFFLRLTLATTTGIRVLRDHQLLSNLWLLPLRDLVAMGLWIAGFASNEVVWRGERFVVKNGRLIKA